MEDHQKTKAQLIEELQALRARLEESPGDRISGPTEPADQADASRPERSELQTGIRFVADLGLLNAQGVDVSDTGICFETREEISFEMEFEFAGETRQHRAQMVWMKLLQNGHSRFGFRFIDAGPSSGLLWLYKGLEE